MRYDSICYWAPSAGGTEVDLLIERGGRFTAIEVKAKRALTGC